MRTGNVQLYATHIQEAAEQLSAVWDECREHWNDERARHFEEEFIKPLLTEVGLAIPAISHVGQLVQRASRECEE